MSTKRKAAAASQQTLKSEEFVASDSDEGTVDNGRASRSKEKQEEAVDSEQEAEEEKPKQKKQKKVALTFTKKNNKGKLPGCC